MKRSDTEKASTGIATPVISDSGAVHWEENRSKRLATVYINFDDGKAIGFAYGYVLNEPDGQKVYYLHAIDVMEGWQNQG